MRTSAPLSSSDIIRKLNRAPRKDLIRTLRALQEARRSGEKIDYNASNETLKRQIEYYVTHPVKGVRGSSGRSGRSKIGDFCALVLVVSLSTAVILLFVWLVLAFFVKKPVFCDENRRDKCVPCPVNAVCSETRAKCLGNRTLVGLFCVDEDADKATIGEMLKRSVSALRQRAGDYQCERASTDWLSFDQLDNMLVKRFSGPNYQAMFEKTIAHLKAQDNVVVQEVNGSAVFVASDYHMSLKCAIRQKVLRHRIAVGVAFLVCVSIGELILYVNTEKKRRRLGEKCAMNLLNDMKLLRKSEYSQQMLQDHVMKYAGSGTDKIWPYIERAMVKSRNVQKTTRSGRVSFQYFGTL